MHNLLDTLANPVFWIGFGVAMAVAAAAFLIFVALIGHANDDIVLQQDRRSGDTGPWPRPVPDPGARAHRAVLRATRGGAR